MDQFDLRTANFLHRILLVDDEVKVLNALGRALSHAPYQITATTSPDEALHLLEGQEFSVILTDQRMPDMQGVQLLERAKTISPHTIRVILTGCADMQSIIDAINRGAVYRFLIKPCRNDELRQTLRQAVERFELARENQRLQELTQAQLEHLHRLNAELLERRHLEMRIAAGIQQTLLQGEIDPLLIGDWDAAALVVPSQQVGGDFFDFFHHGSTCFDLVVGDVMGKGVPAALLGAAAKARLVRAMALQGTGLPEPEEIIAQFHRLMTPQLLNLRSFVTLCYARFDLIRQRLCFVDCGHTPILHYRRAAGNCAALKGENLPVGIRASEEYQQITTAFGPGDRFLFYSDGVTEAQDPTEGYYGDQRLTGLLCRHASCTPHELIERLRADVNSFAASKSLTDDLTCLAVAVGPPTHSVVV